MKKTSCSVCAQAIKPTEVERPFCSARCKLLLKREIDPTSDCWNWTGRLNDGYGGFYHNSVYHRAHRLSHELFIGPVPSGLFVLHSCDNRRCFNPAHLRAGTHRDNMDDMLVRQRHKWGSGNGRASLTDEQMREIRTSAATPKELGQRLGCHAETIRRVRSGRTYGLLD